MTPLPLTSGYSGTHAATSGRGSYSVRPPANPSNKSLRSIRPPGSGGTTTSSRAKARSQGGAKPSVGPQSSSGKRGRFGRVVAFIFCILFAVLGFVPVFAAVIVRTRPVQDWVAKETSALLEREVGAKATFDVRVKPWPLTIGVENLVMESDDGGGPFVTVERASLRPRIFSLLAGKLDVGEVEVTGAKARVVIRDGELANFHPKPQEKKEKKDESDRLPFRALALTDVSVDLDVDGVRAYLSEIDLDVVTEPDGAFEVAVRAGGGALTRKRPSPGHVGEEAADEDRLCHLEARARIDPPNETLLVRRLALAASVDMDPEVGTRPSCDLPEKDWRRVSIQAGALEVPFQVFEGKELAAISGRVGVRVPVGVVHRFVNVAYASGMVELEVEARGLPRGEAITAKAPLIVGTLHAEHIGMDGRVFSDRVDGAIRFDGDLLTVTELSARWADGEFKIQRATLAFDKPGIVLDARNITADNVEFQGLMRDLGVHPQSHVGWTLERVEFDSFGGTLDPLDLSGKLVTQTKNFGFYDRPSHKPDRRRMISVDRGDIQGTLAIRPNAAVLEKMQVTTPRSSLQTTISLGFTDQIAIDVAAGSHVELGEISPLSTVEIHGNVTVAAHGVGTFERPRIEGDIKVDGFKLGGIEAGDIRHAHVVFLPLNLELTQLELVKNQSLITSSKAIVDFAAGPDVLVDADVATTTAPYLRLPDFFQVFHLDKSTLFQGINGTAIGTAKVHYAIGGAEDKCGGGVIDVKARMQIDRPELIGETFERGSLDMNFRWDDAIAGSDGMALDVGSVSVQDGTGSITAQLQMVQGGALRGTGVIAGMPLAKLESLGGLRDYLDGEVSAIALIGGTLSRPSAELDVSVTPLRFGANRMPSSRATVRLEPDPIPPASMGQSKCGHPIPVPEDPTSVGRDLANGQFRIDGQLFDGQVQLTGVTVTNQSSKVVEGTITLDDLDVGTILGGTPAFAFTNQTPDARVSATIDLRRLETTNLAATDATIDLDGIKVSRDKWGVRLVRADNKVVVKDGEVEVPEIALEIAEENVASTASRSRLKVGFTAKGKVLGVFTSDPILDLGVAIAPFDLATLRDALPSVDRITGTLSGAVDVNGTLNAPRVTGYAKLRDGSFALSGLPMTLEQIAVDVALGDGELRVTKASANVGAGKIDLTGRVPIVGLGYGTGTATITVRGVKLPVGTDIDVVADADLDATLPASTRTDNPLPELRGTVSLASFVYRRPIALSLDLGALSRNIGRTEVEAYDPEGDFLRFSLRVVSPRPLIVRNDLADIRLEIVEPGIELSGTNQRYGAKGSLRVLPDSKIRLRNHEFDVREGFVRFDDPTKVKALIDVRANTDMRRYATAQGDDSSGSSTTAGQWDVSVHAHGSTDDMKLDLSSDPPLDQEDIVLLLTVGMTRAEIDRGLATSLGETVGLEALSALTGADKAVQSVVPIIDYFHFGSSYSSRTGRTEPNVTVGKRLNDDLRASVTTTLTERDVAATVEWRLKKGVSIQASYDNTNDIGTIIGNLGADLRWRLEFE